MQALLKKFSIAYWRTPEYNYIRFITTVILGFVLGTLYWKIGHKRYALLLCIGLFYCCTMLKQALFVKSDTFLTISHRHHDSFCMLLLQVSVHM